MSLISFSTLSTTTHWLSVPCFTFTCWANFTFTALAEKVQTVNYLMVSMPISIGSCFCSYILVSLPALLKSEAEVLNTSSILNQIFPPQQYVIHRHDILLLRKWDEVKLRTEHIESSTESHHCPCCCHYPLGWSLLWWPLAGRPHKAIRPLFVPSHRGKVVASVDH